MPGLNRSSNDNSRRNPSNQLPAVWRFLIKSPLCEFPAAPVSQRVQVGKQLYVCVCVCGGGNMYGRWKETPSEPSRVNYRFYTLISNHCSVRIPPFMPSHTPLVFGSKSQMFINNPLTLVA